VLALQTGTILPNLKSLLNTKNRTLCSDFLRGEQEMLFSSPLCPIPLLINFTVTFKKINKYKEQSVGSYISFNKKKKEYFYKCFYIFLSMPTT
jgi:hypothetical protein